MTAQHDPTRLIEEGNALEDAGHFAEGLARYDEAVLLAPDLPRVHLNRGNALLALGEVQRAVDAYATALAHDPDYAAAHYNLGNAHVRANRRAEAGTAYRKALALKPDFVNAEVALGALHQDSGQPEEAVVSYRRALAIEPNYAAVHANLGDVLMSLGRLDAAVPSYRRALELDPVLQPARNGLRSAALALNRAANLFAERGEHDNAIAAFQKAIDVYPDSPETHCSLGNAYRNASRADDAVRCYRRALALKPDFVHAHVNLGNALLDQGKSAEAEASYRRALELVPDFPEAHINLGNVLKGKGLLDEAIACFEKAIASSPNFVEAHFSLGNTLLDQDRGREAQDSYRTAMRLNPAYIEARWANVATHLPAVYESGRDPVACREAFSQELEQLDRWFDSEPLQPEFNTVRIHTPFYLAYQEENNRELLQRHGRLCARLMESWLQRQNIGFPPKRLRARHDVIRVGIVSHHLRSHSVWHAITKGWFQQLDRKRFALLAFNLSNDEDNETSIAKNRAAHYEHGIRSVHQWVKSITAQQPDVLIYPEFGMEPIAGQLASLRLAPLQVATWGHPETTGLPTIDCYLSAESFEPPGAQENYAERLVALPGLGCYYDPDRIVSTPPDLNTFGIDPGCPLLLCPGVPYKYAPKHDWVFLEIAKRLGECRFVFFNFPGSPRISAKLRNRLTTEFARHSMDLDRFAVFLPWQSGGQFFGFLQHADVFMDTIGFSGFNTAMKAIECGLPVVTREGRFLRGRLASGILKRMGMDELVAQTEDEYVSLVVRVSRDAGFRQEVRQRIEASRHVLFRDAATVRKLEEFLIDATDGS